MMSNRLSSVGKLWERPITRVFLSALVLFIIFTILPINDLWSTVKQVPFWLWLLSVIALIAGHSVGVMKWRLLINTANNKLPVLSAFRCYFAGLFTNIFLPSITGGDIVRAGLAIRLNKEKERVILGSIMDRVLDASALVLITLSGTLLSSSTLFADTYKVLLGVLLAIFLFVLCCVIILVVPSRQSAPKFLANIARRLHFTITQFIKNPLCVLIAFCGSIIIQMWFVLLSYLLAWKIGISLSFKIWLIVWPMAKLSAMLPISLGGLGVREAALAGLLRPFGVGAASAVGLGLLWESLFFATGGLGGLFYLYAGKNISISKLAGEDPTY
jgi:uncharacterized protein (TIRG00374 family)